MAVERVASRSTARRRTSPARTANPLGPFLWAAMLLRDGLGRDEDAQRIEAAVERVLADGLRTPDLGGEATTESVTAAVLAAL